MRKSKTDMPAADKSLMNDHDLLIRVDTKLTQLSVDVKEVKDGTNARIAALESKSLLYDKIIAEYPPEKYAPIVFKNQQDIHDFKLTYKVGVAIAAGVGAFVTWVLTTFNNVTHVFGGR